MKKILTLLLLLTLFVFLPKEVRASVELTKLNCIVIEPKAGEHPVFTADFIVYNDEIEVEVEGVEVEWLHVQSDLKMTSEDVFNYGDAYKPNIKDFDAFISILEQEGYTLSSDYESYLNGFSINEYSYFVVEGVDELNLELIGFNVGNTPNDTFIRYSFSVGEDIYSFVVGPFEWGLKTADGTIKMEQDEIFQENVEYVFDFTLDVDATFLEGNPNDFLNIYGLVDMRTKLNFNTEDISNKNELVMIPSGRLLKVETQYKNIVGSFDASEIEEKTEYFTTLFADLEYQLPKTVKVLIGNKELSADKYTYNSKTGSLVIPGEVLTDNLTIVAEAVPMDNPDTSDNIMISIFTGVVSLVGLIGTTLYLKKKLNRAR